mmetsp:Transcript_22302/g.76484  ORF Transcript_22302/g.76484 Transcript_22302/m.76484 type:complete len:207 (-) Transcript_22302:1139-1759(-)
MGPRRSPNLLPRLRAPLLVAAEMVDVSRHLGLGALEADAILRGCRRVCGSGAPGGILGCGILGGRGKIGHHLEVAAPSVLFAAARRGALAGPAEPARSAGLRRPDGGAEPVRGERRLAERRGRAKPGAVAVGAKRRRGAGVCRLRTRCGRRVGGRRERVKGDARRANPRRGVPCLQIVLRRQRRPRGVARGGGGAGREAVAPESPV